jgi:hypothetical protein
MADLGGSLWALITVGFVVILAAALAYGTWMWTRAPRDAWTMARKDAATRRNYSPDAVEEKPILSESSEDEDKEREKRRA